MYKSFLADKRTFKKTLQAFTFAEVLVTLLIIGVVASLVVPALVQDTQNAEYKVAYKKAYADACKAWKLAFNEGLVEPAHTLNSTSNYQNFLAFKAKFNIIKNCNNNNTFDCWVFNEPWHGIYPSESTVDAFIDSSGRAWTKAVNTHIYIFVDTNGLKGPNQWGKDRFPFIPDNHPFTADVNINYNILPSTLQVWSDLIDPSSHCPSGNCLYTSWLVQ